ncbi:DUF456 family protein [Terrilactibacillus sp. S3-3]|nr:DUF456 family protein [Terrilactibacillus sp. S3-3]
MGVDLGASATAAGVGAVVGSAFLGPVGTVLGALAGTAVSELLNYKFGKKSAVDLAKDSFHREEQKIASWLK